MYGLKEYNPSHENFKQEKLQQRKKDFKTLELAKKIERENNKKPLLIPMGCTGKELKLWKKKQLNKSC